MNCRDSNVCFGIIARWRSDGYVEYVLDIFEIYLFVAGEVNGHVLCVLGLKRAWVRARTHSNKNRPFSRASIGPTVPDQIKLSLDDAAFELIC